MLFAKRNIIITAAHSSPPPAEGAHLICSLSALNEGLGFGVELCFSSGVLLKSAFTTTVVSAFSRIWTIPDDATNHISNIRPYQAWRC